MLRYNRELSIRYDCEVSVIDTAITCKACGRPIVQIGGGHRKKEYCDEACKQIGYRRRKELQEREQQQAAMRTRWGDYLPETQQVLEDVMHLHSVELASRVASAIKSETAHAKEAAQGQIVRSSMQVRKLEHQLKTIKNVEELFRNDIKRRAFGTWMEYHARYYVETSFGQRFLDGIKSKVLPRHASRSEYERIMYHVLGYSQEDIRTFHEAWKAMLVDKNAIGDQRYD